jgi:hypothetical protein
MINSGWVTRAQIVDVDGLFLVLVVSSVVASKEELLRSASEEALAVVRYQMVG